MNQKDYLLVFTPSGKRGRFPTGTPILQAARKLGVDIDSVCGGRAICGRCQVEPAFGEFAKHGIKSTRENLSVTNETEICYADKYKLSDERRLSCQTIIQGDMVIDVPASSQVHHQLVRKDYEAHDIEIDPIVHLYFVEVEQPKLDSPDGDLQRLQQALKDQWQLDNLSCDFHILSILQGSLRNEKWKTTVAVRANRVMVAMWPGFKDKIYGVALDIGSTTLAAQLCDLTSGEVIANQGMMNPQIRFGEDLMSRVSYCMQNPDGANQLTLSVRQAINELINKLTAQANIEADDILEMTVVGNPIMHHLFLGIDPQPLGVAPFALVTEDALTVNAREVGININLGGRIYTLPCIAGHVGADAAAVLLAESPQEKDVISLIVDVGTNAEITVGNKQRLLSASSPTGPAFEGAQISNGQRAAAGAIERVRIDPDTLEPRFKVIGCDIWSDDPDFRQQTENISITGICGSGIIEAMAEMYLSGIISQEGVINGELASKTGRIIAYERTWAYIIYSGKPEIRILQTDVRAIQLAKAALYAGARLLMDHLGINKIDRIRLAGAFGSYIDVKYAMVLGLIPDCDLTQVSSAGNAAGTGARIALLDKSSRYDIEQLVRRVEKIETAVEEKFQQHFIDAMLIPHSTDHYENLGEIIKLPEIIRTNRETKRRNRGIRTRQQNT